MTGRAGRTLRALILGTSWHLELYYAISTFGHQSKPEVGVGVGRLIFKIRSDAGFGSRPRRSSRDLLGQR